MRRQYELPESGRIQFAGLYILWLMANEGFSFQIDLPGDEKVLEPIIKWLMSRGYVEITSEEVYDITPKGRDVQQSFEDRYRKFLAEFDIFCAVDLSSGEFGFETARSLAEGEWEAYLAQERFDDLRVAVAESKGLDPVEIIFMSYINEGRFGLDSDNWNKELLTGAIWQEILSTANTALKVVDLGYETGGEVVPGEVVIADIIDRGTTLLQGEGSKPPA